MKKVLSIILTLCVCFSVCTLAAPSVNFTVENTAEHDSTGTAAGVIQTEAELNTYEKVIYSSYEFDTSNEGITFITGPRRSGTNYCPGGTIDNSWNEDGYITAVFHKSDDNTGTAQWLEMCGDPHSGTITKTIQAADVDKAEIRIRLRKTVDDPTYTWNGTATFQILTAMNGSYSSWATASAVFPVEFGTWQTVVIDLSQPASGPAWNGYSSAFQFHPVICGYEGYAMDIDYVRFLYRENVKKNCNVSVTVDGQSLSEGSNSAYFTNGIFEFTFDEAPSVSADEFVNTFLSSNAAFSADGTVVSDDGKTFTVYAVTNLRGETVEFSNVVIDNIIYKMNFGVTFDSKAKEGENIIVNGDFANPYLLLWKGATNEEADFDTSIVKYGEDNVMKAVFGKSTDKYFRLIYSDNKGFFDENTKYLFRIDMTFPSVQNGFDMSKWDENSRNTSISNYIYCPMYNWEYCCDNNSKNIIFTKWNSAETTNVYPTVYKSINANNLILNNNHDNRQSVKRLIDIGSKSTYTSTIQNRLFNASILTLEARLSDAQYAYEPTGMYYYIHSFSIKELFNVNVDANGGQGGFAEGVNLLYATNEEFVFPENPFTKETYTFAGWEYNGNVYQPNDCIVADVTGDGAMVLKAVWEADAPESYAPNSIDTASIRADKNSGIRFAAYTTPQARESASEYGILIARTDMLGDKELKFDPSNLPIAEPNVTFNGKTADGVTYIGAANYIKTAEKPVVDKIYKIGAAGNEIFGTHAGEGDIFFTGVLIGLEKPYTAADGKKYTTRYNVTFTARPYVKIGDNYFYGTAVSASMKDVAQALKDSVTPGSAEEALVNEVLEKADKIQA